VDLGGKFHQVQVTSAEGSPLGRSFRIGRGRAGLAALQQGVTAAVGAGIEAIYTIEATQNFWQELVHPLRRAGATVYLVSPSKTTALRTFYRRHTKTDEIDAAATSRLPRVDPTLHPAVVGDERFDALRRLVRQSWQLREAMANRKRRIMSRVLMVYPGYDEVFRNRYCGASLLFCRRYLEPAKARRLGRSRLATLMRKRAMGKFDAERMERLWSVIENAPELAIGYDDLQRSVNLDLDLLEAEERAQQELRERIAELYGEVDPGTRLTTIPGLGEFLAAAITAFIGEPGRFRNADEVVALSGLCPRKKSSAGSDTANQPLTKHGDPTLRSCLYVAAEIARHYDPELRAFHVRLRTRGKHYKQATCALAAKILRRCWAVLREERHYVVEHQATLEQAQQEGKTIRASVHEVAERLNDDGGVPSPAGEAKSSATSNQNEADLPPRQPAKRLRRKPAQPRPRPATTPEPSLAAPQRSLS
jgi:transposase